MSNFDEESIRTQIHGILQRVPPRIPVSLLPNAEKEYGESIDLLILTTNSLVDDLESALDLFEYLQIHAPQHLKWQIMAASDGVMTVWNFGKALDAINAAYKHCPTLMNELGGKHVLRPIIGKFGAHFSRPSVGSIDQARNANAHYVEQIATANDRRTNSLPSGLSIYRCIRIVNGIPTIEYSRQRKLHTLEFSRNSLARLQEIRNSVFNLFRQVSQKLFAMEKQ